MDLCILRFLCSAIFWSLATLSESVELTELAFIPIGLRVVRGRNWKDGNKDGGAGYVGVVLAADLEGRVFFVQWSGGKQYSHRKAYLATAPAAEPTDTPTDAPTGAPTGAPTDAPTGAPTDAPTDSPTNAAVTKPKTAEPELAQMASRLNSFGFFQLLLLTSFAVFIVCH